MIAIADSGSSHSSWKIIDDKGQIISKKLKGINPLILNEKKISEEISSAFNDVINTDLIYKIYFYGAGCRSNNEKLKIQSSLKKIFINADIIVETDLLGAARALFLNNEGLIAILGTGSNSGIYNGFEITQNIRSLGYIIGDEGSGVYFGKAIITLFYNNLLPEDLNKLFKEFCSFDRNTLIDKLYNNLRPNQFLAEFAPFVIENKNHKYLHNLITEGISKFFKYNICLYKNYEKYNLGFCGSIAYYLKDEIIKIARNFNFNDVIIISDPIEKLIEYHLKYKPNDDLPIKNGNYLSK
jgi:N-acetylglucosamine kinase-like BadF-type ATPase